MTTTSTSGSVLQALGLGSGLDIDALVTSLTDAEMSAAKNRVEREQESVTAQVSAVASLKSALAVFQASMLALTTGSTYSSRSASSSDTSLLTVSASADAAVGSYSVTVEQLATAQQLLSNAIFADGASTVVGTGELTLSVGGESFSVTIDSSNSTLAGIRDAINDAAGNTGVSATLVYGTGGAQLLLSSDKTGEGNEITVASSGGDGGLAQLEYSASNTVNYTQEQAAQDAIVYVAGVEHHSSDNQISDAIDGLTFNLVDAEPSTTVTVRVSNNTDNVVTLMESFIDAYNTMNEQLAELGKYDKTTDTAGELFGDPLYNNLQRQLSRTLRDPVSGASGIYNSLSSLGVTTDASGNLVLDEDELRSALSDDFESVTSVLQSSTGLISRMDSFLDEALSSDGQIAARDTSLDSQQERIDEQTELNSLREEKVRERYLAKFNAMDSLLAQLQNTSDYLTQTFDALTKDDD